MDLKGVRLNLNYGNFQTNSARPRRRSFAGPRGAVGEPAPQACPRHACSGGTVSPGRATLTNARGAGTPGIAAGLNAPSPALTSGGAKGAGQSARSRGACGDEWGQ